MRSNMAARPSAHQTHEGAPARRIDAPIELRRSVLACLLWENEFYEDGNPIAERIANLVHSCTAEFVRDLAIEARTEFRLRHVPLLLVREMARSDNHKALVADTLYAVIQRADELAEFLAIYWRDGRQPLSAQVKKGLARAFTKFSSYALAKYNRDNAVKLRDVLFLCHAKPKDDVQKDVWKQLVDGTLTAPDTWEVALSAGDDKKATFERLIRESKLGYMALLRNLRNMSEAGVDEQLIRSALLIGANKSKALPFRFISAAKAAPRYEGSLDTAMKMALNEMPTLKGRTIVLVDVSYSMLGVPISKRSDLSRMDAAAALAVLVNGIAEICRVFTFSTKTVEVPARQGLALVDAVINSQDSSSTYLGAAVERMNVIGYDRLIVITDEQSHDPVGNPIKEGRGYMINVASSQRGVGYGPWTHIDGFSEAVVQYIQELERESVE